jgi:hypothetical protein
LLVGKSILVPHSRTVSLLGLQNKSLLVIMRQYAYTT